MVVYKSVLEVPCPYCDAIDGEQCTPLSSGDHWNYSNDGTEFTFHSEREDHLQFMKRVSYKQRDRFIRNIMDDPNVTDTGKAAMILVIMQTDL